MLRTAMVKSLPFLKVNILIEIFLLFNKVCFTSDEQESSIPKNHQGAMLRVRGWPCQCGETNWNPGTAHGEWAGAALLDKQQGESGKGTRPASAKLVPLE